MRTRAGSNSAFICYRRATSGWVARSVFQNLREHSIDVFLDVESIDSGDFRQVIEAEIRSRPYFLPVLTPAALERCIQPDDLLRREFETGLESLRQVVPLLTPDFDRTEVARCLPGPLAERLLRFNSVTVDHEYFEASMKKLRSRFLKPVNVPLIPVAPAIAPNAERILEAALSAPAVGSAHLNVQKHFERAFALASTNPERAATAWEAGAELLKHIPDRQARMADFDLTYLALQEAMQRENAKLTAVSALLKASHERVKHTIRDIR